MQDSDSTFVDMGQDLEKAEKERDAAIRDRNVAILDRDEAIAIEKQTAKDAQEAANDAARTPKHPKPHNVSVHYGTLQSVKCRPRY